MQRLDPAEVLAIHDLLYTYAAANDDRDVAVIVDCFTEEGSFGLQVAGAEPIGPLAGQDLHDLYATMLGAQSDQRRHVITNVRVSRLDEGRCRVLSYFTLQVTDAGVTKTLTCGVYTDTVIQHGDGGWRFESKWLDLDGQP